MSVPPNRIVRLPVGDVVCNGPLLTVGVKVAVPPLDPVTTIDAGTEILTGVLGVPLTTTRPRRTVPPATSDAPPVFVRVLLAVANTTVPALPTAILPNSIVSKLPSDCALAGDIHIDATATLNSAALVIFAR